MAPVKRVAAGPRFGASRLRQSPLQPKKSSLFEMVINQRCRHFGRIGSPGARLSWHLQVGLDALRRCASLKDHGATRG
jgi:hypothetical protein